MKRMRSVRRKVVATLVFSLLASLGAIVHGIFLDLDVNQLQRLSLEGFLVTFAVVFPSLLFLEWIFDLENKEEFMLVEKRISALEKKVTR